MPISNFQPIRLLDPDCLYIFTYPMANSADPDQLDLHCLPLIWIYTVCKGRIYLEPAGLGLNNKDPAGDFYSLHCWKPCCPADWLVYMLLVEGYADTSTCFLYENLFCVLLEKHSLWVIIIASVRQFFSVPWTCVIEKWGILMAEQLILLGPVVQS